MAENERPGGWVDGIGWVVKLFDVPAGTWVKVCADINSVQFATDDTTRTVFAHNPFVLVIRWADGTRPTAPAPLAPLPVDDAPVLDEPPAVVTRNMLRHPEASGDPEPRAEDAPAPRKPSDEPLRVDGSCVNCGQTGSHSLTCWWRMRYAPFPVPAAVPVAEQEGRVDGAVNDDELYAALVAAVADWKSYVGPPYIGGGEYARRLNGHMRRIDSLLSPASLLPAAAPSPDVERAERPDTAAIRAAARWLQERRPSYTAHRQALWDAARFIDEAADWIDAHPAPASPVPEVQPDPGEEVDRG